MVHPHILEEIRRLLAGVLEREGMELVDLKGDQRGKTLSIKLFMDKPGGVTVEDCAHIAKEAMDVLDMENVSEGAYSLEVSSPGIDRPLRSKRDFERAQGRKVRLTMEQGIKPSAIRGRLIKVQDHYLTLEMEGKPVEVPLGDVREGKMEVEF